MLHEDYAGDHTASGTSAALRVGSDCRPLPNSGEAGNSSMKIMVIAARAGSAQSAEPCDDELYMFLGIDGIVIIREGARPNRHRALRRGRGNGTVHAVILFGRRRS